MKKNQKLNDFIKHTIDCESYGNITKNEILKLLQSLYSEILKKIRSTPYILSKKTYTDILVEIEDLLKDYKANCNRIYETSFEDISEYQSNWLKDFMKELGKDIVIPATILSSIKFSPVANTTGYKDIVEREVFNIRENVNNALKVAYLTKEDTEQVAQRIEKREVKTERDVTSDSKTINTAAFSTVSYLIYKANKQKVVYSSILDTSTCFDCGVNNGKVFEINNAPMLPIHYNCRCYYIPYEVTEDLEVPESYLEWIETLSDEEQYEILGKTRYQLYKAGFPIKHFVDDQDKLLPVKEVKKIAPLVLPESKFVKYFLDKNSKNGGGKAIVFEKVLGYNQSNWEELRDKINNSFDKNKLIEVSKDEYGIRYKLDVKITGPNGNTATVRTGWIKESDNSEEFKLTTAFVK